MGLTIPGLKNHQVVRFHEHGDGYRALLRNSESGDWSQSSGCSTHDRINVSVPDATGTVILCLERSPGRCREIIAGGIRGW